MSLSQDLASIRKDQKLSLEDLHALSKLPVSILESIENGFIFEDETKNVTYKRSFVRSYAKALRIEDADISKALDDEIDGTYSGSLASKYIGRGSAIELKNVVTPRHIILDTTDTSPAVPVHKTETQIKRTKAVPSTVIKKVNLDDDLPPQPDATPYNKTQKPPTINSVDWASVGNTPIILKSIPKIIASVVAVLVVIAAAYWLVTVGFSSSDEQVVAPEQTQVLETEEVTTAEVSPLDSLSRVALAQDSVSTASNETENSNSNLALGDTLSVIIVALTDKLEPVRVKTDISGSYFPYWLEKNSAMRFTFVDKIEIKGQYERMGIIYNNRLIEELKSTKGTNREVRIDREVLSSNSAWLTPATDAEIAKLPKNMKVVDRPVFN